MMKESQQVEEQATNTQEYDGAHDPIMRDIHAPSPPSISHRSVASSSSGEGFTTISREFNALVLAGSRIRTENEPGPSNMHEETNPALLQRVKKEEVKRRISAWQTAKIAKINNWFKREEAVIHGWEDKHVHKSCSWMKQVERKIEEKRARAMEKMQNEIAKSHRKAEEKRACAEGKRGAKVARVVEIANLMRAMGTPPTKRSFFSHKS